MVRKFFFYHIFRSRFLLSTKLDIDSFFFFFLSIDSILPSYITAGNNSSIFRSRRRQSSNIKITDKRSNENLNEKSVKRVRTSSNQTSDELQSTLNVFDIFNQSDQIILNDHQ